MTEPSKKLAALAAAQERVRISEARVTLIRELEKDVGEGLILRIGGNPFGALFGAPIPIAQLRLEQDVADILAEGLIIVRSHAMDDLDKRIADVEGMLK